MPLFTHCILTVVQVPPRPPSTVSTVYFLRLMVPAICPELNKPRDWYSAPNSLAICRYFHRRNWYEHNTRTNKKKKNPPIETRASSVSIDSYSLSVYKRLTLKFSGGIPPVPHARSDHATNSHFGGVETSRVRQQRTLRWTESLS